MFLKNNYPVYCRKKSIIELFLHGPRFTHTEFFISKKKFLKLNYIEMILKRPQREQSELYNSQASFPVLTGSLYTSRASLSLIVAKQQVGTRA